MLVTEDRHRLGAGGILKHTSPKQGDLQSQHQCDIKGYMSGVGVSRASIISSPFKHYIAVLKSHLWQY